jgi:hypothetical protein
MRGSQVRFLPGSPPVGPFPSAFWSALLVLLLDNHRGSVSQNFSYTLHNLELVKAKDVFFWLLLGGFVWVIGTCFSSTPPSMLASAAVFRSPTQTSSGGRRGAFWCSESCAAGACLCMRR